MSRQLFKSITVDKPGRYELGPLLGAYLQSPKFRMFIDPQLPGFNDKFETVYQIQRSTNYDPVLENGRWQHVASGAIIKNVNSTDTRSFPNPPVDQWFRGILYVADLPQDATMTFEIWADRDNIDSVFGIPPEESVPDEETDDVIDLDKPGKQPKNIPKGRP